MTTIHELHILLTEIKGDVKTLVEDSKESKEWQRAHEIKDEERFSNMNKYASSIAIVASVCGGVVVAGWDWVKKKVGAA